VSLTIRPAAEADAATCAAIYRPFVTDNWVSFELEPPGPAEMARRIAAHGQSHAWLIAECDGVAAGYAYGSRHAERGAYLHSVDVAIYIDAAFARRGIGKALYGQLLPLLKAQGAHAAFAAIVLPNDASVGLHEHMGFSLAGIFREAGWKMDGWRDVGWWQQLL
jgi:L-amino acid N-acyltransferase YncA